MKFSHFVFSLLAVLFFKKTTAQTTPFPLPSPAQQAWHETEFYLFFHFGPNTFTDVEWGHGHETEAIFNPSALDCGQWCRAAKAAGARGVVITAKHHDGFCLWPSANSTHTVRESPWKNGYGDVLHELADSCKNYGLKLGLYLSPWDRNHPKYGTPEYNDVYAATLTELLTGYGPLFEIWWDGANGEGPNGKKQVYDFHRFEKLAAQLQPDAVIFSDIGPGCRWAGNERGVIETETNWAMLDTAGFGRGATGPPVDSLNHGNERGKNWLPAECDVSIRPGWFYHSAEDEKVKTPDQLFEIYLKSVGRGANLILNVPPDRRGLIHENDMAALAGFGKKVAAAFDENLTAGKKIRLPDGKKRAELTDENLKTSLKFEESGASFELDLKRKTSFNCLILREDVRNGQRIRAFKLEVFENGGWREITRSTTVGVRKFLTFEPVEARKIRVTILDSNGPAKLSEMGLFRF